MRKTKPRKATGADEVDPHLLRDKIEYTASRLTRCYNKLWETERWPECGRRDF